MDFIHDFIHVNSGRIELHPGATDNNKEQQHQQLLWGQHLHYETRHSWCGPQQMVYQFFILFKMVAEIESYDQEIL